MAHTVDQSVNQALQQRFAEVQSEYERVRKGIDGLQQQLTALRVSVTSDDELVTATVAGDGQLAQLELSPHAYRAGDPAKLAATITATVRKASAQATERVVELISAFLPPSGVGATDFIRSRAFGALLRRQDAYTGYDPSAHNGR
jgi:DNA-binding protein YbaB